MSRTILFIHGMFMTGRSWAPWVERFERAGYRCVAPSWPGRDGDPGELRERPPALLRELTLDDLAARYEVIARVQEEPPILVGHAMGGLIVQLLLARGVGVRGVAIGSAPPLGIRSLSWSHLCATLPILRPGAAPIVPSYAWFKSAFWQTGSDWEVRALYASEVVPESRLVARGPSRPEARIDFEAERPQPLLMIAGERDAFAPAALNRKNAERYAAEAPTELLVYPGRTHAVCWQPGWEEVATEVRAWVETRPRISRTSVRARLAFAS